MMRTIKFRGKRLPDKEPETKDNMEENFTRLAEEPENEPTDVEQSAATTISPMGEKELNLCELLKDCEGETFYSDVFELVVLTKVNLVGNFLTINWNRLDLNLYSNGSKVKGNRCVLWPSKELYEKYPLDTYSAWMEWKEARKPRFEFEVYLSGYDNGVMMADIAVRKVFQFKTYEEIMQATEVVKEALHNFHEQNNEKTRGRSMDHRRARPKE